MSYSQNTKTTIQFGGERLEAEGHPTDVKALAELFFKNVLELEKGKTIDCAKLPAPVGPIFGGQDI